jgi:hypothetical protein
MPQSDLPPDFTNFVPGLWGFFVRHLEEEVAVMRGAPIFSAALFGLGFLVA